jgi:hypothetical protein
MWQPGETLVWNVRWGGVSIGRAQLSVGPRRADGSVEVTAELRTTALAAAVVRVEAVSTAIVASTGIARDSQDRLWRGGRERRSEAAPGQTSGAHSVHTALAAVRGWAAANPTARGQLEVAYRGRVYDLEVAPPDRAGDARGVRIDCRAVRSGRSAADDPLMLSLWLSDDDRHALQMIEITTEDGRLAAELIED